MFQGEEVDVVLSRMARIEMSDRVRIFELFTSLQEFARQAEDEEQTRVLEDVIDLYTKMQVQSSHRDTTIVHNVMEVQQRCSSWLLSLREKLKGLHLSIEDHIAGYGDQIMELQVLNC